MILIALGANLPSRYGSPAKTLLAAMDKIEELGVKVLGRSRIWVSAPVPASDQPWYHNAVISVRTAMRPEALMVLMQAVEADFGRVRTGVRNEARILDLDIVAYHDEQVEDCELVIPHPRLSERAFVLYPLRDVAPDWTHPVSGLSVEALIDALPADATADVLKSEVA